MFYVKIGATQRRMDDLQEAQRLARQLGGVVVNERGGLVLDPREVPRRPAAG